MFKMQRASRLGVFLIAAFTVTLGIPSAANADAFSITISIDENGHGLFTNTNGFSSTLPFTLQDDPGPGGFTNAPTYGLLNPPGLTEGDVRVLSLSPTHIIDVVRFNPMETCNGTIGCIVFYSSDVGSNGSLADIGLPTAFYTNAIFLNIGLVDQGFTYTPTAGQPGFITGAGGPVTYVINQGTAPVPEPSSILTLGIALGALIIVRRRLQPECIVVSVL